MKFLGIVWNEFKKEILIAWSYKSQWIGEFFSLIIFYLFLSKIANHANFSALSYSIWFYSILIIGDINGKIATDMRLGTFEQVYLSTSHIVTILLSKVIATIIKSGLLMSCLLFLLLFNDAIDSSQFTKISLPISILIITPGLFGISLMIGGLTIFIKDVGWVINVVNNSILFLSGTFLSLESFPYWLQQLSLAIPTTQAIKLMHEPEILSINLPIIICCNFAYLIVGGLIFFFLEKKAKLQGILGHH